MKRHLGYRVVAGLWGVWFAAALIGPAALHACPEHAELAHSAHASAASHDGHAAIAAQQDAASTEPKADADCNCLGDCTFASAIGTPKHQPEHEISFGQTRSARIPDSSAPRLFRDYIQPFANGPPAFFATA